jgi:hypothetical protein
VKRLALVVVAIFVAVAACSTRSAPPAPGQTSGASAAPATPAPPPTPAVRASVDAATDAPAAPPAATGPAPTFWLGSSLALGAHLIAPGAVRLDAAGPGEVRVDTDDWTAVIVRRAPASSGAAAAVRGQRLAVYSGGGDRCEAVVTDVYAVRTLEVPVDLRARVRDAAGRATLEDQLWRAAGDGFLAAAAPGCDGVLAVPAAAAPPAITRLQAASAEIDAEVRGAFERGRGADLDGKAQLEHLDGVPWRYISTRTLSPPHGDALAVAYVSIFGVRTIALFPLPTIGDNWPLTAIAADTPSTVLGVDADGDGALDAVIGHPAGTALYLAGPNRVLSVRDGILTWSR